MIAEAQAGEEDVTGALAELVERQARVTRAEGALHAARRRLGESLDRLTRITTDKGVPLPPLAAAIVALAPELPPVASGEEERPGTLRARIVAVMEKHPEEVFNPARLAPMLGSPNRDSIRNTLLVLAGQGRIQKLGEGRYQARKPEGEP